jgi:hypothetical protein
MHNLAPTISEYIENQFPEVYREDGPNLVAFIKAYYEYLESTATSPTTLTRTMFQNRDIDETLNTFIVHFKEKYLSEFPYAKSVDNRFAIKHIMDYYRSKGTPLATKLLIRMLFNEDAEVYYPGDDVFKASDSKWHVPRYIEVSNSTRSSGFVNKQITGSRSGAKAFVEGIVSKRIQGRMIDILFLSNIQGTFRTNELVTDDGIYVNAPNIIGSLSSMIPILGGRNNVVGDIFNVVDDTGKQGKVRVTGVEDATGRVDFNLIDGGTGYTLNDLDDGDTLDDYTDVRVATAMIPVDNSNTSNQFIQFEKVVQERNTINILSSTDINSQYTTRLAANTSPGDYLVGVKTWPESYTGDGSTTVFARSTVTATSSLFVTLDNVLITLTTDYTSNATHVTLNSAPASGVVIKVVEYTQVANSLVYTVANTDSDFITIGTASAYSSAIVVVTSGTFANQISVDFATATAFIPNETVLEESTTVITHDINGSTVFANGDKVEMKVFTTPPTGPDYLSSYAYGYVSTSNTTSVTLEPSWGTFIANEEASVYYANGSIVAAKTENINTIEITTAGAIGLATSNTDANTWTIEIVSGEFTAGKKTIGIESRTEETITALRTTGASDIWYNGVLTANGVIDTVANTTAIGVVVGQNTTFVGLHGNTQPFSYIKGAGMGIKTAREELLAVNLAVRPNLDLTISNTGIGTGTSASFQPGALENEETVTLNTDFLNANNISQQKFLNVVAGTASNSAFGFVDSITINSGVATSNGTSKYISAISQANPAVVTTTTEHGFTEGNALTITDVKGMTQVNDNEYFVEYLTTTTFALYQNSDLSTSIDSTGFTAYTTGGGTLYANGTGSVTFTGGGYADGDPKVKATGSVTTDVNGVITTITVDYGGEGYWATPTIVLPSTSGTAAVVVVNMDHGYGFVKNPSGDQDTEFQHLFTFDDFTMGTITSLTRINPGANYNTDPFISLHNKYIAAYDRRDIILFVELNSGGFKVGEIVEQDGVEKGVVKSAISSIPSSVTLTRTRFNTSWSGSNIIGAETGASASILDQFIDESSKGMGTNAVVTGTVIVANGVATSLDVIDSGYGYLHGQEMELIRPGNDFIISANSVVATEGTGTGYWTSTTSHISDASRIHDNKYYQEFSYDVQTGVSLNKYERIFKKVLHVAGTELFGTVVKNSNINTNVGVAVATANTVSIA